MRRQDSATDVRDVSPGKIEIGNPSKNGIDLTVLGVCTGTGLLHLDCALVRFGQKTPSAPLRVKLQQVSAHCPLTLTTNSPCAQFDSIPILPAVRDEVINHLRAGGRARSKPAPHLDDLVGSLFSDGIKAFCRKHGIESSSIDLVGAHSEALKTSDAQHNVDGAREHPRYWNAIVAAETGISTVYDFTIIERAVIRPNVHPTTYVDRLFLRHPSKFRVCLNISEVANLSFIPAQGDDGARATMSRNVGPGSLLIDYAMRYCTSNDQSQDHDGKVGSLGTVNQGIVDRFLDSHDYLRSTPSRNIATEMFGDHEAQQLIDECLYSNMSEVDTLATVTRVTAQNILKQYRRLLSVFFPPNQKVNELFICGPSARNSNIVDYLESELPESVITKPLHDIGIPGDAHEAVCYAYLALEAVLTQTALATEPPFPQRNTYPDTVRAQTVPGRRWQELISTVVGFSGGQPIQVPTDVRITGNLEAAVQGMDIR
jgi:1,6-anhydro-N-acetylmuramate kinase